MKLHPSLTTVTPISKFLAMLLFVLLPFFGFYLGMQYGRITIERTSYINTNKTTNNISPSPAITALKNADTSSWKTFTSPSLNISFKYPPNYEVIENTSDKISLGGRDTQGNLLTFLIINSGKLKDYRTYPSCSSYENSSEALPPCLEKITTRLIDKKTVLDIYLGGFEQEKHIAQTLEQPLIEFNMNIAGARRDYNFNNILSSIKFN